MTLPMIASRDESSRIAARDCTAIIGAPASNNLAAGGRLGSALQRARTSSSAISSASRSVPAARVTAISSARVPVALPHKPLRLAVALSPLALKPAARFSAMWSVSPVGSLAISCAVISPAEPASSKARSARLCFSPSTENRSALTASDSR